MFSDIPCCGLNEHLEKFKKTQSTAKTLEDVILNDDVAKNKEIIKLSLLQTDLFQLPMTSEKTFGVCFALAHFRDWKRKPRRSGQHLEISQPWRRLFDAVTPVVGGGLQLRKSEKLWSTLQGSTATTLEGNGFWRRRSPPPKPELFETLKFYVYLRINSVCISSMTNRETLLRPASVIDRVGKFLLNEVKISSFLGN